jgi:Copper binding proteins, plastocyanin/azurin family
LIAQVLIAFAAFGPPQTTVLAGDTVTWTNIAARNHTVDGLTERFDSPELGTNATFSHTFENPGAIAYYCRIHAFMRGEVDVFRVLLDTPTTPATTGRPYTLRGRAALPAGSTFPILADDGSTAATATVGDDGEFSVSVTPSGASTYHAPEGNTVRLDVLDRRVSAAAARHGSRIAVSATVAPAAPGATVVLQLKLKERFGWWPVARAKLDAQSHVRFNLRRRRGAVARVVMTLPDGATALAVSPTLRISSRAPARSTSRTS